MHASILALVADSPPTAAAMCTAGAAVMVISVLAARNEFFRARGLDRIVALRSVCVAVPLAVFGALHLFGPRFVSDIVPPYMPGRSFWVFSVGCCLISASLSIATRVGVRWSGVLFGIMMFLFVAMIHFPGALRRPHDRIIWVIVFRELSFGGAGWMLAAGAMDAGAGQTGKILRSVGRGFVTIALLVFGAEILLHPTLMPGVPLAKDMPDWVPARALIGYVTGAALLVAGASVVLRKHARAVTAVAGGWILLLILAIYTPFLVTSMADPAIGAQLQGVNYFADTMLFAGAILALASTTAMSEPAVGQSGEHRA